MLNSFALHLLVFSLDFAVDFLKRKDDHVDRSLVRGGAILSDAELNAKNTHPRG
jgi:hypothetical protein